MRQLMKNQFLRRYRLMISYFIAIAVIVGLSVFYFRELSAIISDPMSVRVYIDSFGVYGPFVLILLQTFQVILFFVPGPIFTVAGGFAFGIWLGTFYSLIGTFLGSMLAFFIARKLGRPFVDKFFDRDQIRQIDDYLIKKGPIALFIIRVIPVFFPGDVVSFAAALTKMKFKTYAFVSFVGFIPQMFLLTIFGDQLVRGVTPLFLIVVSVVGLFLLSYVFREPLFMVVRKKFK